MLIWRAQHGSLANIDGTRCLRAGVLSMCLCVSWRARRRARLLARPQKVRKTSMALWHCVFNRIANHLLSVCGLFLAALSARGAWRVCCIRASDNITAIMTLTDVRRYYINAAAIVNTVMDYRVPPIR